MRIYLLYTVIGFLSLYAVKDWYKPLCFLIVLMAINERPDMPKSVLDIPGLNPWNFLLVVVVFAWVMSRQREKLVWDMPRNVNSLLLIYVSFIFIGVSRMLLQHPGVTEYYLATGRPPPGTSELFNDYLLNTLKYLVPGMLVFVGCNSRERFNYVIIALLAMYFLIAIQVIKFMPLGLIASGDVLQQRAITVIDNRLGYFRVDVSMMLGGAAWAMFITSILVKNRLYSLALISFSGIIFVGQLLTGGRAGIGAWAVIGIMFAIFRFRKLFLLLPAGVLAVVMFMPHAVERMTQGFNHHESEGTEIPSDAIQEHAISLGEQSNVNLYSVTSGRNFAWPLVMDKISEKPFFGYGALAMQNTGLSTDIALIYRETFPHPHNAYLEWIFDNGIIAAVPVFLFYFLMIKYSFSLFRDSRSVIFVATGGICLSLVLAQLLASIGAQSFYPRAGAVGMWCAIGLMLRVYVERDKILESATPLQKPFDELLWHKPNGNEKFTRKKV